MQRRQLDLLVPGFAGYLQRVLSLEGAIRPLAVANNSVVMSVGTLTPFKGAHR